jgi:phosphohistidine phosphatase
MKRLSLVRHAKSDWGNELLEDIDRPLNARGYKDARVMAELLKAKGLRPDAFVSSTAIRASSTALIFSRCFELQDNQILLTPHLYDADEKTFLDIVKGLKEEWKNVFIFGHNGTITDVANRLGNLKIDNIPTCGVVVLESSAENWKELSKCQFQLFEYPKKPT